MKRKPYNTKWFRYNLHARQSLRILLIYLILVAVFASAASAGTKCVTKDGYLFATTKEYLNQAVNYIISGDEEALAKLMAAGVVAVLKDGVVVYREDVTWTGIVAFRLPGGTQKFWTVMEALSEVNGVIKTYTTEDQKKSTNKDEPKIIPGLTAANIKSILEKSWGLVFSGPQKGKLLLLDRGEAIDSDTGIRLMCDIYETSPQKVQWVEFIVDPSPVMGLIEVNQITKVAERYFSSCATISYDGANPTKAKQWVAKNVSKAIKPGLFSTQIGKAEINLSGTKYARFLEIIPIGGVPPPPIED